MKTFYLLDQDIFAAGTDTSSSTLEWTMTEMMRNPTVREKAQAELRQTFREKQRMKKREMTLEMDRNTESSYIWTHLPSILYPIVI